MSGHGRYYNKSRKEAYVGQFIDDRKHGRGATHQVQGLWYHEGEYANDDYNGYGKRVFPIDKDCTDFSRSGSLYQSRVCFASPLGAGMVYEGEFVHHQPHGKGAVTTQAGAIVSRPRK